MGLISIPKLFQLPKWELLKPLLVGGLAVQLRNVALNVTFLSVTRATQGLDQTGVAAAAHSIAIQVFQVGGIFLLGLATVASAMVPNEMEAKGKRAAKNLANRLMAWGCVLGSVLGAVQIAVIPAIKAFSPLPVSRGCADTFCDCKYSSNNKWNGVYWGRNHGRYTIIFDSRYKHSDCNDWND